MENNQTNDLNEESPKKKAKRAKVPFATKAAARVLIETGHSYRETAAQLNVAVDTVQRAMKDNTLDRQLIEKVKANLPNKLYLIAFAVADRLLEHPEFIEKMNPYMCSLVMAIMVDKARLMSDQSTENLAVKGTVAEVQATLKNIQEMRQRLSATSAPARLHPEPPESQEPAE